MSLAQQISEFARLRGVAIVPGQFDSLDFEEQGALEDLARYFELLEWPEPEFLDGEPAVADYPLLGFVDGSGWRVISQPIGEHSYQVWTDDAWKRRSKSDVSLLARVVFPSENAFTVEDEEGAASTAFDVFYRSLAKRPGVFVSAILATIFANVLALVTSLYSMQIYDRVIPRAGYATLIALTAGAFIGLLLDFLLRSSRALMMEREAARVDEEVSEFFFARTQAIRLDARPKSVGTLAAQLRGMDQIRSLMSSSFLFLVADLPFALFFVVVIYWLGGIISLVPLIGFPVSVVVALTFARMIRNDTDRAQVSGNRKNGMLVESLDAAETIKSNAGDWFMLSRWNKLIKEVHDYEDPVKRTTALASGIFAAIQQATYTALIAWGAVQVTLGEMTIGALIACGIIAGRVNGPLISMLPQFIVQSGYARSSLKALDNILSLPREIDNPSKQLRPTKLASPVVMSDIEFSYGEERSALSVPALQIEAGERIVLIGGVGSGKTTLLKVLAGLYRPARGRVTIGGLDASQIAPDILRAHVGYIPQDPRLINASLRENLLLGIPDPGDDAILEAAKKTGLDRLIASHPRGLSLEISEGGRGLSGGQRMQTLLTRLLLLEPDILLLDEPTSNLDQSTEALVLQNIINTLGPNKTLVMVTHKLPLIRLGTRALIMNAGRIVHDDTAENILNNVSKAVSNPNLKNKAVNE
jgi:ATP-binding cassette subfamily C protein LapB